MFLKAQAKEKHARRKTREKHQSRFRGEASTNQTMRNGTSGTRVAAPKRSAGPGGPQRARAQPATEAARKAASSLPAVRSAAAKPSPCKPARSTSGANVPPSKASSCASPSQEGANSSSESATAPKRVVPKRVLVVDVPRETTEAQADVELAHAFEVPIETFHEAVNEL